MYFIDLFSGIGGIRLALEQEGYKCIFSSEIDKNAITTYESNFKEIPFGDIRELTQEHIVNLPNFDLLAAGFPCQSFSVCGKQEGFADQTRGTLFFEIVRILKIKKPKVLLLENVSHLINHDKKRTFQTIKSTLEELGYNVFYKIINSYDFGLPQNRERIYIVCFLDKVNFNFPKPYNTIPKLKDILEESEDFKYLNPSTYTLIDNPKVSANNLMFSGYLNKEIRKIGAKENALNLSRTHKQQNRIYSEEYIHPCLCAGANRYYILTNEGVRNLTITECFRLQGFSDDFIKPVALTHLYKQVGNSVSIPVIREIVKEIKKALIV